MITVKKNKWIQKIEYMAKIRKKKNLHSSHLNSLQLIVVKTLVFFIHCFRIFFQHVPGSIQAVIVCTSFIFSVVNLIFETGPWKVPVVRANNWSIRSSLPAILCLYEWLCCYQTLMQDYKKLWWLLCQMVSCVASWKLISLHLYWWI